MARDEWVLSEPPRRITALPALRQSAPASAVTFGPALEDHADDAERRAHALDMEAVGPVPFGHHRADRIGQRGDLAQPVDHRGDALVGELQPVEEGRGQAARRVPRAMSAALAARMSAAPRHERVGGGDAAPRSFARPAANASIAGGGAGAPADIGHQRGDGRRRRGRRCHALMRLALLAAAAAPGCRGG